MDNTAFDYKRIAQGYKNRPFLHKNLKVVKYILKTLAEYYTKFFKIKRIT